MYDGVGEIDWGGLIQTGLQTAGTIFAPEPSYGYTPPMLPPAPSTEPVYPQETIQQTLDRLFGWSPIDAGYTQAATYPAPTTGGLGNMLPLLLILGGGALLMVLLLK